MKKIIRNALVLFIILALALCAYIPIQQQILRHRAERLLSDIKALQLRKSTWSDAQLLMKKWGAWGEYEGSCTKSNCAYRIELADWLSSVSEDHPQILRRWESLEKLYTMVRGRQAKVVAEFTVADGLVWRKAFNAYVLVSPNSTWNYPHLLIASSESSANFFPLGISPDLLLHPEYLTGSPSGCTDCLEVWAKFTPYADLKDIDRLMQVDLSCISRHNECRRREDIMPAVWLGPTVGIESAVERMRKCDIPLQLLGREAQNVAEVEIAANHVERTNGSVLQFSTVRLVRRLKAAFPWEIGTTRDVEIGHPMERRHYLVFYSNSDFDWMPNRSILSLNKCGVVPATEKNLAEVKLGIERDYASRPRPKQLPLPE